MKLRKKKNWQKRVKILVLEYFMKKIIAIIGTTASKKSDLGIFLAQKFNGEIVSCDSRQIYKGLDLGSGKVTKEEQKMAIHHMLDIVEPGNIFSVAEFQRRAYEVIDDILRRGKLPILVGGTGLYVRAITDGYSFVDVPPDPELREWLAKFSRMELIEYLVKMGQNLSEIENLSPTHLIRRIELAKKNISKGKNLPRYKVLKLALTYPRAILKQRIKDRIDIRLKQGMIEEIKSLLKNGVSKKFLDSLGLEYRYISRFVSGEISYQEFYDNLLKDTCAFAKRQITWFKKDNPIWIDPSKENWVKDVEGHVINFLKN